MAAQIAGVIEPLLQEKINQSKILVVGAGGIGCEVLKNLVMSGFPDIEIVSFFVLHEIRTLLIFVLSIVFVCNTFSDRLGYN